MKVLFAGSSAIAITSLETLCRTEGVELAGVLTNPDTPKGRHGTPFPTEIGEAAEKILQLFKEQGRMIFPILKPKRLDAAAREQVGAQNPKLLISFAYGHIFGPKFLSLFPLGGINIHPSLLPKYRGPTPIQAALLNRDIVTGITIQKLALGIDNGDILAQENLQLTGDETTGTLSAIIAEKAAFMLPVVIDKIVEGRQGMPQDHSKASYCSLIKKDDGLIDWKLNALEIEAKIRAFSPWPLCRTVHNDRELFILKAGIYKGRAGKKEPGLVLGIDKEHGILIQTGEGILCVRELQYQSKKALFFKDFLNGIRDFSGSILG
jgi:methionyl-tRNA formyltransferase